MNILIYLVDERGQLWDWQSSVQLQEWSNVGDGQLLLNLVHEDLQLLVVRLHQVLVSDAFKVRRHRRQELRASVVEHVAQLVTVSIFTKFKKI